MLAKYLKHLAVGAGGALAVFVFLVPLSADAAVGPVAPSPAGTAMSPAQVAAMQAADAEGAAVTAAARALGPYLVRHPDGTLSLNAPPAVVHVLPAKYVEELTVGLVALNAKVLAGQLQTTAAGAVFDPKADALIFQGGWTGHGSDWWHDWYCLNHNDVQRMTNFGWWTLGAGALAVLALFAATLSLVISAVVFIYGGWMYLADHGNGSCMNFGHFPPPNIWVTSQ
jgi:hypothetical protein